MMLLTVTTPMMEMEISRLQRTRPTLSMLLLGSPKPGSESDAEIPLHDLVNQTRGLC